MNSIDYSTSTIHKVGFISPPAWLDISPAEFLRITPEKTITLQTIIRPHDFGYKRENFINSVTELQICYDSLNASGVNAVVQFGYPFSLFHGWEKASRIQQKIENRGNAHFIMMGVGVVNALKRVGCKSVAIASTYYSGEMSKILSDFLTEAGLDVLNYKSWQLQKLSDDNSSSLFVVTFPLKTATP